jgi:hypothetical protein
MTRHIADHQTAASEDRLAQFTRIEIARSPEGSHPAARTLHERPATRTGSGRLQRYLKIEKGVEA